MENEVQTKDIQSSKLAPEFIKNMLCYHNLENIVFEKRQRANSKNGNLGNINVKPKEITTVKRAKTLQNPNGVNSENSRVNNKINPKLGQKAIQKKVKKPSIKMANHHEKLTIKHKRNPSEYGVGVEEILKSNLNKKLKKEENMNGDESLEGDNYKIKINTKANKNEEHQTREIPFKNGHIQDDNQAKLSIITRPKTRMYYNNDQQQIKVQEKSMRTNGIKGMKGISTEPLELIEASDMFKDFIANSNPKLLKNVQIEESLTSICLKSTLDIDELVKEEERIKNYNKGRAHNTTYINCDLRYFNFDYLVNRIGSFDGNFHKIYKLI